MRIYPRDWVDPCVLEREIEQARDMHVCVNKLYLKCE